MVTTLPVARGPAVMRKEPVRQPSRPGALSLGKGHQSGAALAGLQSANRQAVA